jgi:hypothetical protein
VTAPEASPSPPAAPSPAWETARQIADAIDETGRRGEHAAAEEAAPAADARTLAAVEAIRAKLREWQAAPHGGHEEIEAGSEAITLVDALEANLRGAS